MTDKTTRQRLSHAKAIDTFLFLQSVCRTEVQDGIRYAVYADGWSDEKAAEHLNVGLNSIQYLRMNRFGSIKLPPAPLPPAEMSAQLADLNRRLERIETKLASLLED